MTAPRRIQRRRTKGWRMPPGAVYVARPTVWGNPFGPDDCPAVALTDRVSWEYQWRDHAVSLYRAWLHHPDQQYLRKMIPGLAGRDLVCWCPLPLPCHADVLLAWANSEVPA